MTQKIILYIAASTDGFIARKNGSLDWLTKYEGKNEDYGYTDFLNTVEIVIMGDTTYKQVLTFGDFPYKNKECFVFSRDKTKIKDENVTFANGDVLEFIKDLKTKYNGNIWLVGGATIVDEFLKQDLVDEFIITVVPVLLGEGISLFSGNDVEKKLKLINMKAYENGLVQLHYERIR